MSPSILSDGPSVPIRGSRFVGIDSIKKLTTPGSVGAERVQEESTRTRRREVKEIKEIKEVKENPRRSARIDAQDSDPPLPLPPAHPLLPLLPCITHLAQHHGLLRSGRSRHIRGSPSQRLPSKHGKCKRFLRIAGHAKLIGCSQT